MPPVGAASTARTPDGPRVLPVNCSGSTLRMFK